MKKTVFLLLIILLLTATLSSCTFSATGDSIEAFSRRMNELNENYNMTSEGYIIDQTECTLKKFYKFSEKDIMLNFKYDKKYRLNEMNIVFASVILEENSQALAFICDSVKSFVQNESTYNQLLELTDFENAITKIDIKTKSAEADNIKMEIDTTELGTVITIYKDI